MSHLITFFRYGACIIILCMFTTACSTTFFYRHMDWLLIRFVEGYVQLNKSQKQHIRSNLTEVSAALEESVLPDLQALLDRLAEDNQRGLMATNIEQYMQQVEVLYKRAARLAEPGISVLALSLNSEQKKQLFQEFARRDKKFQRKYIANGEAHARQEHLRTLRKKIRKWLSRIGTEQDAALQTYAANYQTSEQRWLDSRRRWQTELKQVLGLKNNDAKSASLSTLLLRPQNAWTQEYRNAADHNRSVSVALTRQLATEMNDSQRAKFARQLGKNQKKVDNFAAAIAAAKPAETADQQFSPSAATAALPPAGLARKADNH